MRSILLSIWLVLGFTAHARAEEVEVTAVRFANLRAANGSNGNWLETEVQLNVRPGAVARGQVVSRVRVAVLLGFELAAAPGAERRVDHYRAEAECVALEAGRASVRFYLPPEVVKRDQLQGDPKYWGAEVAVAGKAVAAGRAAYSTTLATPEQRRNFQARGGAAAAANDGILLPQYLTPFAHEYPRATPSFVRRETR